MNHAEIPIVNTSYNSPIIDAYINRSEVLKPFYPNGFDVKSVVHSAKNKTFDANKRAILVDVLKNQYKQSNIDLNDSLVGKNIDALTSNNTFTITAGQQIHAYLGPMFVAYKLFSAVALAAACQDQDPKNNYVPVFWMATEDHDFEEISSINLFGENFNWQKPTNLNAAVGALSTTGLDELGDQIIEKFKNDPETAAIIVQMQNNYKEIPNFADATRKIIHQYFQSSGIVILDANNKQLKTLFAPVFAKEIANPQPELIDEYSNYLEGKGLKKQINPRESNLFLFHNGNRERLTLVNDNYQTADSQKNFSKTELLEILKSNPESFSPNVALRPLYQEYILPNLAYISGGSEMIYWFQIKGLFEYYDIKYPNVWLRKSGMIISNKIVENISKVGLSLDDMFNSHNKLSIKIANSLNANNAELFKQICDIQESIDSFESKYRTSKLFNKSTLDLIKTTKQEINKLNKRMEDEQNILLNESPIFSKMAKIQASLFSTKQERALPLFTQLKITPVLISQHLYNNYINNTQIMVYLT